MSTAKIRHRRRRRRSKLLQLAAPYRQQLFETLEEQTRRWAKKWWGDALRGSLLGPLNTSQIAEQHSNCPECYVAHDELRLFPLTCKVTTTNVLELKEMMQRVQDAATKAKETQAKSYVKTSTYSRTKVP